MDRAFWEASARQIAGPVLRAASRDALLATLPRERPERHSVASLEAVGRVLCGLSGWLTTGSASLDLREQTLQALHVGLDPSSADRFAFSPTGRQDLYGPHQGLVDAAFLAMGFLRAPALWGLLSGEDQGRLVSGLIETRGRRACASNWLLFAGVIEGFLAQVAPSEVVPDRIDRALRQTLDWYVGDGIYGDGPRYCEDYYNSFVIHPMLIELVDAVGHLDGEWSKFRESIYRRAERYAEILERHISPEGTFPFVGRSIAYRFGAMQHLALMAAREQLPDGLHYGAVRAALTAVLRRFMVPENFDDSGWLTIGFTGNTPELGEGYISRASVYGFCWGFHPLSLGASHPFWTDPAAPWTSVRAWGGGDVRRDGSIDH